MAGKAGAKGFSDRLSQHALPALFTYPSSVAVSADGADLYVADTWNHRVRVVTLRNGDRLLPPTIDNSPRTLLCLQHVRDGFFSLTASPPASHVDLLALSF